MRLGYWFALTYVFLACRNRQRIHCISLSLRGGPGLDVLAEFM